MERKAFLANPNHQYRVSQLKELNCSAHNKKKGDYYEHPSLSHSMININYKGNGGMKTLSCKSKASISRIPVR